MKAAIYKADGTLVEVFDSMREAQAVLGIMQDSGEGSNYYCAHYGALQP